MNQLPAGWGTCIRTVGFHTKPVYLTSWKDLIAVGLYNSGIIIIDAITGAQLSFLSGHTRWVSSLTFSLDGTLLVSGDYGGTIKLWDVQTGVVAQTLEGHTGYIGCVSISPDHTTIASGSEDKTILLWNTWTGECSHVIDGLNDTVNTVIFSPTNSQLLISACADNTVQWWDVNGHKIGPTYEGKHVVISSDGMYVASWEWEKLVVTVRNSGSGAVVAELQLPSKGCCCCQFSPDRKSVACGIWDIIYIWDITNPAPHFVGTFIGHTGLVRSITFSSSLISLSEDSSLKLWEFGTLSVDPAATRSGPAPLTSAPIRSVSLQTDSGIVFSFDSTGVVRSLDILTGLCKASFHTPVRDFHSGDMQLVNDQLIFVWEVNKCLHIWGTEKGGSPKLVDASWDSWAMAPKISGDRSKVFFLAHRSIQAWSI